MQGDEATIVSIYPLSIRMERPHVTPNVFAMDPGSFQNPEVQVIGPSVAYFYGGEDLGWRPVEQHAAKMAASYVQDFALGCIATTIGEVEPGLFWLRGGFTLDQIKRDYKSELNTANERQKTWFIRLVKLADDMWNQTKSYRAITGLQREAAGVLGMKPEWLVEERVKSSVCPACLTPVKQGAIVCSTCRTVLDSVKMKSLGLTQVA